MSDQEIKPCPFCASTNVSLGGINSPYVVCHNDGCLCYGPTKETQESAIAAWNAAPRPFITPVAEG